MQEEVADVLEERSSPGGRTIRVRRSSHTPPTWVARRRQADNLIDQLAAGAKRAVRRWLVPRPDGAPRRFSQM